MSDQQRRMYEHWNKTDQEQQAYVMLHKRLSMEQDLSQFLGNNRLLCRFLDTEPNPVYIDALLTALMRRALLITFELAGGDQTTYSWMVIRDVTKHALRTEAKYRGILEAHNTEHQE